MNISPHINIDIPIRMTHSSSSSEILERSSWNIFSKVSSAVLLNSQSSNEQTFENFYLEGSIKSCSIWCRCVATAGSCNCQEEAQFYLRGDCEPLASLKCARAHARTHTRTSHAHTRTHTHTHTYTHIHTYTTRINQSIW